jgi:polyisoprenyl-phosphate glycosyltransferase
MTLDERFGDSIIILMPVFNDWESVELLIQRLDERLAANNLKGDILLVNDGSTIRDDRRWTERRYRAVGMIEILELSRNLGHQRAIAVGLAFAQQKRPCRAVVVMDADGEDSPEDVPRLIEALDAQKESSVIFAQRMQRSEGKIFKAFYMIYKAIFFLLTGSSVGFGNFSVVPYDLLCKVVVVSEIWNHYAAAVMKARIPYFELPTKRGKRLHGQSRMNFVSLVVHGLAAISVHSDVIGVRVLIAMSSLTFLSVIGILVVAALSFFTDLAIPSWALFGAFSFIAILLQAVMTALLFVFVILSNRSNQAVIPRHDYEQFVLAIKQVYSRHMQVMSVESQL